MVHTKIFAYKLQRLQGTKLKTFPKPFGISELKIQKLLHNENSINEESFGIFYFTAIVSS